MAVKDERVGFAVLGVAALESRMAEQMTQLIERHGGRPLVAPSMREVPLEENADVLRFGERLLAGEFDMVILLTGVGTRFMLKILGSRWPRVQTLAALGKTITVVRGPKPLAVLRENNLQPTLAVPEPNRSEEHTSELQSPCNLVCRLLLEKKNTNYGRRHD